MRFLAVLNREGGSLSTIDLDAFCMLMRETIESSDHTLEINVVTGKELMPALRTAKNSDADVIVAGGGDGTVSAAAATLMNSDKILAVVPAGTMNLFARSLGIPLSLEEAVREIASGEVKSVDIASANGRPFVHQFSLGMHAKMIQLRSKMSFASRLGKIGASAKAAWDTIRHPPSIDVTIDLGESRIAVRSSAIGITNNLFGEGHLPYAERPDGGVLGVYLTIARQRGDILRFILNMARGKWRENPQVEIYQSENVTLRINSRRKRLRCAIDGELCDVERETKLKIHRGALRIMVPASVPNPPG